MGSFLPHTQYQVGFLLFDPTVKGAQHTPDASRLHVERQREREVAFSERTGQNFALGDERRRHTQGRSHIRLSQARLGSAVQRSIWRRSRLMIPCSASASSVVAAYSLCLHLWHAIYGKTMPNISPPHPRLWQSVAHDGVAVEIAGNTDSGWRHSVSQSLHFNLPSFQRGSAVPSRQAWPCAADTSSAAASLVS